MEPPIADIIFYTSPEGNVRVEVIYEDESFWLTQKHMAELFGVETNTINYRLKEIFKSGELREDRVIRKIRTVRRCDSSTGRTEKGTKGSYSKNSNNLSLR